MPKTTIRRYRKLEKIRGNRSLLDAIRSLLRKRGNAEILMIAFGTRNREESDELEKEIKEVNEWMSPLV